MTLKTSKFGELNFYFFIGSIITFSGFCSLVYQVAWDRTLRYNFGGDSVSSAIVTATFLLGLGVGAFIFGKWHKNAIIIYGLVEIGIGLYATISYFILAPLATGLGQLFNYSITDVEGLRSIVIIACIFFLLVPCILMGGTLPLIFNCFVQPGVYKNRVVGMLYGLNTAGASVGVLAVPFVFLNRISIPSTLLIVGGANILLGVSVLLFRQKLSPPSISIDSHADETSAVGRASQYDLPLRPLLVLSFISGFIVLSFEISLLRTIGLITKMSPYTFPLVLMPFLLSLALGSILATRFRGYSTERALGRAGLLFVFAMIAMLAGVLTRNYYAANILLLIVPVPLLLGGVFPLLLRLASSKGKDLPRRTGTIYLANSVGAFLGAMFTQFYGFSNLGTRGLIIFLFIFGIGTGLFCLIWAISKTETAAYAKYLTASSAVGLAFVPLLIPINTWDIYTFNESGQQVEKVEGASGVATINWEAHYPLGDVSVNGTYMSALPDHPKHVELGSIALSMPRRQNILVLGLGGGGMVRELVHDPEVKRVDVIDWSHELPVVLETQKAKELLEDALQDPKVRIFRADARVAVSLYEDESFDVVIDNLAILGWAGSTSIKSLTYFSEINRILKPGGEFVFYPNYLWSPDREAVLAGLVETFQYVQEHETTVIVASSQPVQIDPDRAKLVLENRGKILGLAQPYANWLLKGFKPITSKDLNNVSPIIDELLIYEYRYFGRLHNAPSYKYDK